MRGDSAIGRRSTLRWVVAFLAGALLGEPADRKRDSQVRTTAGRPDGPPDGTYSAAVDRIVDDDHVVVLLEEGDAVVGQFVVRRGRLPGVEEGTRLVVRVHENEPSVLWRECAVPRP